MNRKEDIELGYQTTLYRHYQWLSASPTWMLPTKKEISKFGNTASIRDMDNNFPEIIQEGEDNILKSYPAGDISHPDWYIYEYGSHRKVLVEVNPETGKAHFLREL